MSETVQALLCMCVSSHVRACVWYVGCVCVVCCVRMSTCMHVMCDVCGLCMCVHMHAYAACVQSKLFGMYHM